MVKKEKKSEAELCAEFREWMEGKGYVVYPEVSDWDLVAVKDHLKPEPQVSPWLRTRFVDEAPTSTYQIGFQAKLYANVTVLYQASQRSGPHVRMVLVPKVSTDFVEVAKKLGVGVATCSKDRIYSGEAFCVYPAPRVWPTTSGLWLPPVAANLPAGAPSPRQLTKWRVAALKLCITGRVRGYVTSADFKKFGVDQKRWTTMNWMIDTGEKDGRLVKYRLTETAPDVGWEEVVEELSKQMDRD